MQIPMESRETRSTETHVYRISKKKKKTGWCIERTDLSHNDVLAFDFSS